MLQEGMKKQTSGKSNVRRKCKWESRIKREKDQDPEKVRAHMGELKDQFGKSHKLEDYKERLSS